MGEYKKSGGFGGGRSFNRRDSGRPSFGSRPNFNRPAGRDGGAQMFSAVCSTCHKSCEVPFRPSGDKPVYCSDCFHRKNEGSLNDFSKRNAPAPNFTRRDFTSAGDSKPGFDGKQYDDLKKQLDTVTAKLDKLIELVGRSATPLEQNQAAKKLVDSSTNVTGKQAGTKPKTEELKAALISANIAVPEEAENNVAIMTKAPLKKP